MPTTATKAPRLPSRMNDGDTGVFDYPGLHDAVGLILKAADPSFRGLPECEPYNFVPYISSVIDGIAGAPDSDSPWDDTFEDAPVFWASPEPTSINMGLTPRSHLRFPAPTLAERNAARRLLGRQPLQK